MYNKKFGITQREKELNNKLEYKIQFEGKIINLNPKLKLVVELKFKSINYLLSLQK